MRTRFLASLSAVALLSTPAFAQTQPGEASESAGQPEDEQASVQTGDEVVVTGTRRAGRTVADSPVPVDVLTAEALTQSGNTDSARVLRELVPSFNFPQPSITDGTDVIRPATLRGLGPDQTLVLVNGKRRHTSALLNINGSVGRGTAAVDINNIPTIALGRVEVLRDGAAAQYGSDAIAGVINFQLRSAREGGRMVVTYGQYETRIDDVFNYDGFVLENGFPIILPDGTFDLNETRRRRRSDGETLTFQGTLGLPLGPQGFLSLSGEVQGRDDTNRTGADPRRQFNTVGTGTLDPREFTFNRFTHRYGDPETFDGKLFFNAGMPLGGVELYGFGSYNDRDGESAGFYRLANAANNIPAIYPNGFLPLIATEQDDMGLTAGVRAEIAGFRADLSATYGRNKIDLTIENTLNRSLGPASPTVFDAGGLRYQQSVFNLDLSRELAIDGIVLTLAGGLEYREEKYQIRAGEPDSYRFGTFGGAPGAQVFPGFQPVIGGVRVDRQNDRNNKSAYLEIDADLFDELLSLQIAGRYEDYSDFGSDVNGKVAARLEPVQGLALRGAISTGFRAPSLQQQFFAAASTQNVNGVLLDTVTLPVGNPVAQALGATPLEAEDSKSYSAGAVVSALPGLTLTVDAYQIEIDDRIVVTENLGAFGTPAQNAQVRAVLTAAGFPTVTAARFFINGIDTRTRGIDAVATYRFALAGFDLGLTAGANYNKTEVTRNAAASGPLGQVPGLVLFGRQETLRTERGQPRTKINLGVDVDRGPFGLTVRANRYGKVLGAGAEPFFDVPLSAKWVTDLELRANIGDRFDLAVGSNNVFDVYPDPVPRGFVVTNPVNGLTRNYPATNYVAPYSAFSPFGFNGRFVYGRVGIRF